MLSKLLQPRSQLRLSLLNRLGSPLVLSARSAGDILPPSQYDIPFPEKLKLGRAMRVNWEIIPLFVTTGIAIMFVFHWIGNAIKNKVDVVFNPRCRNNISRTMDLRCPTVHKLLIINQRYEPWPEMADVLDKMATTERQLLLRAASCSFAKEE